MPDTLTIPLMQRQLELAAGCEEFWLWHQDMPGVHTTQSWNCMLKLSQGNDPQDRGRIVIKITGRSLEFVLSEAYRRWRRLISLEPDYLNDLFPDVALIEAQTKD